MKRNIVIGGLLGLALGAGATTAIAHGMFAPPPQATFAPEAVDAEETPVAQDATAARGAPTRPLRPGSARIGRPAIKTEPAKPAQS